jgi:SAM-dependent methyltransferase
VAYARRHFGLEMLQAGVYNLPVPDNTYEVVTLLHVFEHFRDPLAALQELKRVLKPGGLVVIETVNYSLHYWLEKQLKFLQPLYLSESGKDLIPWFPFDHYYFWTPASLLRAFSQAGLTCGRSHFLSNYKSEMPGGQVSSLYRLYSAGVGLLFHLSSRRLNLWNVLLATAMKP